MSTSTRPDNIVHLSRPLDQHIARHPSPITDAGDSVDLRIAEDIAHQGEHSDQAPRIPDQLGPDLAPAANQVLQTIRAKVPHLTSKVAALEDRIRRDQVELAGARHDLHYLQSMLAAGTRFTAAH